MTKKTTQKKTAKPKKKAAKEVATEYDYYIANYQPHVSKSELRKSYWKMTVAYFKGWLNTFR